MRVLLISLVTAVAVIILFSLDQASWAALIYCTSASLQCNGTSGDDMIFGHYVGNIIHGLGGNDYIVGDGSSSNNFFYGDDGNDRLIGSEGNDGLYGGPGNDYYDGRMGHDTIIEPLEAGGGPVVFSDDVISGGEGDDFINSRLGADRISGGPGTDFIWPNGYHRDFSFDIINCGSGTFDQSLDVSSSDGDTSINCELVRDIDR